MDARGARDSGARVPLRGGPGSRKSLGTALTVGRRLRESSGHHGARRCGPRFPVAPRARPSPAASAVVSHRPSTCRRAERLRLIRLHETRALNVAIREELPADHDRVRRVTELAFRGREYADGDEQDVIDRLRAAGALALSLVATRHGEVVGHIAFSPATAGDGSSPWFALGPVSVLPDFQRQGIGSALVRRGLSELGEKGALGCILVGDPEYYRRFGFRASPDSAPDDEPKEYFMVKPFAPVEPGGRFNFHDAFHGAA